MPLLKMDKNGQIYESDSRFDKEIGVGKRPELVDEDNVQKLSVPMSAQAIRDRANLQIKEERNRQNLIRKAARENILLNLLNEKELQKRTKLLNEQHRLERIHNEQRSAIMKKAIRDGTIDREQLGGVSGYGLTSDGTTPIFPRPSVDWKPVVDEAVAFGRKTQFGDLIDESVADFGSTRYKDGMGSSEIAIILSDAKQDATQALNYDPMTHVRLDDLNVEGEFSAEDQHWIDQWFQGILKVKFYYKDNPNQPYYFVWNEQNKDNVIRYRKKYCGEAEESLNLQRGWAYSGYWDDNGNWVRLQVPLVHGLPIEPTSCDVNNYEYAMELGPYGGGRDKWVNGTYIELAKRVIIAFARQFKARQKEIEEMQRKAVENAALKTTQAVADAHFDEKIQTLSQAEKRQGGFLELLKNFFYGSPSSYQHPMVTKNLLKNKKG